MIASPSKLKQTQANQAVTVTVTDNVINKMEFDSTKNWREDYLGKVGGYINTCLACGDRFLGHKYRMVCKECSKEY